MGKPKHKNWDYFRPAGAGAPPNKPYVDVFSAETDKPVYHGKDITVNTLWLAFECPAFAETRAEEHADLVCAIDEVTMQRKSAAHRKLWERARAARAARLRSGNAREGEEVASGSGSGTAAVTTVGAGALALEDSVYLHGLRAARQQQSSILGHVQRMSAEDIDKARKLLFRFLVASNSKLRVFDHKEWVDFITFVAPAFAPFSINRAYIRCGARLRGTQRAVLP